MSASAAPMIADHMVTDLVVTPPTRITFTRSTINGQTATDDAKGWAGIVHTRNLMAPDGGPVINDHVKTLFGDRINLG